VLVDALVGELEDAGATFHTGRWIRGMNELPASRVTLFDTSPQTLVSVAGDRLPPSYVNGVKRFRNGSGVCKVDWALSGPVPWLAPDCRRAGTLHLGGSFAEVANAEADVAAGRHAEKPFCIVVQPSIVDASRAPSGQTTLWAYCHVPNGSSVDMTSRIEAQIERFAPGFGDLVLARSTITAAQSETVNPNYVGGDINGGAGTLRQTIFRPTLRWNPYRTGARGLYLCSSSTPPGGGVHGMCGVGAARAALHDLKRDSLR
jgi:phytoene dehydrogenase-like protein